MYFNISVDGLTKTNGQIWSKAKAMNHQSQKVSCSHMCSKLIQPTNLPPWRKTGQEGESGTVLQWRGHTFPSSRWRTPLSLFRLMRENEGRARVKQLQRLTLWRCHLPPPMEPLQDNRGGWGADTLSLMSHPLLTVFLYGIILIVNMDHNIRNVLTIAVSCCVPHCMDTLLMRPNM